MATALSSAADDWAVWPRRVSLLHRESGSRLSTKACGGGGAETNLQPGRGDSQVEAGSGKILHPQSPTKEGSMHVSAGDCSLALGQVVGQC